MKVFKVLISTLAIALLFSGTVGIDIFKHICKKDGVSVSLFVEADHKCREAEQQHACCSKMDQQEDKDCCDDEVAHFQIKLDYFNQAFDFHFAPVSHNPIPVWITQEGLQEQRIVHYYAQPPPPAGRELLIINQVFVI